MNNAARHLEVAETIRQQLGNMALMMLGAKDLCSVDQQLGGLQFRIRGSKSANKIVIILDPSDTYTVQFWTVRGVKCVKHA